MPPTDTQTYDPVDISSLAFWSAPAEERDDSFAQLRRHRPVSFHPLPEGGLVPGDGGFWAVVRHADVVYASRHPDLFCSGQGVTFDDLPREMNEAFASFLVMDAPRHTVVRRLISQPFTPRRVAALGEQIGQQAAAIVREAVETGGGDAVELLAMRLPLWTISEMVGIPIEHRDRVYRAANAMVGTNDPEFAMDDAMTLRVGAAIELTSIAADLAAARRAQPGNDLMTALVTAEVDGQRLSDEEIGAFFVLLGVAGNDTTRNSISHGLHAFAQRPDQWALVRDDPDQHLASAVEEILRWATPVMDFRRTVTQDVELGGQQLRAGDKVALFYTSANRDETVFENPWTFDVTRTPNDHVAFGGGGPHHCLGANLARQQLRAVFGELAHRVARFETDAPDYLIGNFVHGIKRLPCTFIVDG
jgi:cytochrome P450